MLQMSFLVKFFLILLLVGSGRILAQPLNIIGSANPATNKFITDFTEFSSADVLPNFTGQILFSLPDDFQFGNIEYDTGFFAIDPFGFGFPDNFFATQFGLLNVTMDRPAIKELKIFESDTLTSVFVRGLSYANFSCLTANFDPDSAAVRVDFYPNRITVYMLGIPTISCPEFRINDGLPSFNGDYQQLSWFIGSTQGGNRYRSGFGTDSTFNGSINQVFFKPANVGVPYPSLRGGFPEVPIRLDIVNDSSSSTFETVNTNGEFILRDGRVIFLDEGGTKNRLTALNSIGQVILRDVYEIDLATFRSKPLIISCVTAKGIKSEMFYVID